MNSRWIVHIEFHWGYRPKFSIRRAPRAWDNVTDGGERGVLVPCQACSTTGFFFKSNEAARAAAPAARAETESEDA